MPQSPEPAGVQKLDNGRLVPFEQWMARTGARFVPEALSANQVTLLAGLFGIAGGIAFALAQYNRLLFLIGALCVLVHWAGDNIDGQVARMRNRCSSAGRFLDIFLDAVTFAAIGLGFAACGSAHFTLVAIATMLCLLQYVLTVLWIALARIWPFPAFGPAEASLSAILIGLLMPFLPPQVVTVGGVPFSLIDLAFLPVIPGCIIAIATSAMQLYRHLEGEGADDAR